MAPSEEYDSVGWTAGEVSHAVCRADDGSLYWACYFRHTVAEQEELSSTPDPDRSCRRTSCRAELEGWLRNRDGSGVTAGVLVFRLRKRLTRAPSATVAPLGDVVAAARGVRAKGGWMATDPDGRVLGGAAS